MKKETYIKKMQKHEMAFDKLWTRIVEDTNQFIEKNPDVGMYSLLYSAVGRLIDSLCLSGAWIQDRIEKKSGIPSVRKEYRESMTKKIRKALGYNT